ncbi:MAG TPA: selenide, water dikinase SelD [Flavobacteriales bacterium]|nr:selenide, water dikinase SelD [Flavobacteriales bacterium]
MIRLTQYSKGAGCGCKIAPKDLQEILEGSYTNTEIKNLIVGNQSHDDAAVYDLKNDTYLISTTDFFTPIVDDAFDFGKIASANALSDVYAMGGKPIMAIAVLGWPVGKLPNALAKEVIKGASAVCNETGIPLAGGHSIDSPEPFFGLSVNGLVKPQNLKKNNTAGETDIIYLTKPIGSGILTTAHKRGLLNEKLYAALIAQLTAVNSCGEMFGAMHEVKAMTDITGFGLLGHLVEMSKGSGLTAELKYMAVPLMEGVDELTKQFVYPDNTMRNYQAYLPLAEGLNASNMFTLCDPQTNGGLLAAVSTESKTAFETTCREHGIAVHEIGCFGKQTSKNIVIA